MFKTKPFRPSSERGSSGAVLLVPLLILAVGVLICLGIVVPWETLRDASPQVLGKVGDWFPPARLISWFLRTVIHRTGNVPGWSHFLALAALAVLSGILSLIFIRPLFTQAGKMGKIQPLVKEIEERYKDQPDSAEAMGQEVANLYREHGVNPLRIGWPSLLQIVWHVSVFLGLWDAREEFRGVPFLWIADLAEPDTLLFILFVSASFFSWIWSVARREKADTEKEQEIQRVLDWVGLGWELARLVILWLWQFPAMFYVYWLVKTPITHFFGRARRLREETA